MTGNRGELLGQPLLPFNAEGFKEPCHCVVSIISSWRAEACEVLQMYYLLIGLEGKKKVVQEKVNESEVRSLRDGVGRRPAVLFSPAVQTGDMWLPRQAVQSGRARWTHYRPGQHGIA